MSDKPKNLKDYVFGAFVEACRRGDWPAAVGWLGLYLLVVVMCALAAAWIAGSSPVDLASQAPVVAAAGLMLAVFYANVLVWWVARNPRRTTALVGEHASVPRFRPRAVSVARVLRVPVALGALGISVFGMRAAVLYVPPFGADAKGIKIYVARFWGSEQEDGSNTAQNDLIAAIRLYAGEDETLYGQVQVEPLRRLISTLDPSEGEEQARGYAQRGRADLVVWGSVLEAGGPQYQVIVTAARKETQLQTAGSARPVPITKDACLPQLSQAAALAARFALAYAHYGRDDYASAIPLFEGVVSLISDSSPSSKVDRAQLYFYLGTAHLYLGERDRIPHLSEAINCYDRALQVYTEQDRPLQRAATQHNLGNAYAELPRGDRMQNLERAISCYQAALDGCQEKRFPCEWAMIHSNMGTAWAELPKGNRGKNLEQAISHYRKALTVYERRSFPYVKRRFPRQWAATQDLMGTAYAELPKGNRGKNLEQAISHYRKALTVYKRRSFPRQWAITKHNLGNAYADLPTGNRGRNLKQAMDCYERSLSVLTEKDLPAEWAATEDVFGQACAVLPMGDRAQNLEQAISHFKNASRGFARIGEEQEKTRVDVDLAKARVELAKLRGQQG